MRIHPDADWRDYLAVFCGGSTLALVGVLTLNYQADPYLIHQWDTPQVQRLRPDRERLSAWGKTYALAKLRPSIVYAGNSRTELGLPAQSELFAGKEVFNGALSGASLGDALDMMRHAAAVSRLDTVVLGIDAPSFSMEIGNTEFDRELVAGDRRFYLWRRILLNLRRALTVDMTLDSLRLLSGRAGQDCLSSLALNGQRDPACIRDRIEGWGGTGAVMVPRTREFVRGAGPTPPAMRALESATRDLCRANTRVRLYVNPTHAMTMDALYWGGKWPALETWLTALAELAQARKAEGCDLRVYDFSGFNSVTTESIPQVSGRHTMRYYWEASHYRVEVGYMVLARLFGVREAAATASDTLNGAVGGLTDTSGGAGDGARDETRVDTRVEARAGTSGETGRGINGTPSDFGVELLPAAMPAHLAGLRAGRERYHLEHAGETRLARQAVASAGLPGLAVDNPPAGHAGGN